MKYKIEDLEEIVEKCKMRPSRKVIKKMKEFGCEYRNGRGRTMKGIWYKEIWLGESWSDALSEICTFHEFKL